MRTRVKICGITRPEDAAAAIEYGADALGLVFYPPSPRFVTVEQAREIVAGLAPYVTVVGLFVNEERNKIDDVLSKVRIDLLQFHGDETPEECMYYSKPYTKAIRMRDDVDLDVELERYSQAEGLLLDTYRKGVPGGTGATFNWEQIPDGSADSIILAGGLNSENVVQAIERVRPYAVDVSGGVEKEKGIKDAEKIAAFMRGVKSANR
jgi:phosphoribosylanthranilate isomerase